MTTSATIASQLEIGLLLNNLLSRILLRFFKHNKLKTSKTHFFFQMAPRIYYCIDRKIFFRKKEKLISLITNKLWSFFATLGHLYVCNGFSFPAVF
jgi:hypothetical protein